MDHHAPNTVTQPLNQLRLDQETKLEPGRPSIVCSTTQQACHTMKTFAITFAVLLATLAGSANVRAADDPQLQGLALCQDTWLSWKDDSVRMARYANYVQTQFEQSPSDGAFVPKLPKSVFGWPVAQVYPQSVGMGVGFSLTVNVDHARARAMIERQVGKAMECSDSEGVRACAVELGAKKTAVLMTDQNGAAKTSLLGCYYFYQQ